MDNAIEIKIEEKIIGNEKVQAVNARELHERLEVSTYFTTWIQRRLDEAQAIEGDDFVSLSNLEASGQTSKTIYVSLDISKHIAMLERTDIGRKVRQYFIDVEKKAKEELEKRMRQTEKELSPQEMAIRDFKIYKELGELVQLPSSTIVSEASRLVDRKYGTSFIEFTKASPLLDYVKKEEEYLEPTELGQRVGLTAIAMNKKLASLGLQYKEKSGWMPTEEGKKVCFVHQWTTGSKSGYNIKWNVNSILERIKP